MLLKHPRPRINRLSERLDLDYGLIDNADPHAFGKPSKKMVDRLEQRLRALDWRRGHVPEATDRLSQNKLSYAWAAVHAAQWWEEWERTGALPPPRPARIRT